MKNIQTKIIALFLAVSMAIAIIITCVGIFSTRYSTKNALELTLVETAETSALAAQNAISNYTLTIAEVANHPTLTSADTSNEEKLAYLRNRAAAYGMQGSGILYTTGYDLATGKDVSSEPYFKAALGGQTYMSTPYVPTDGSDMYLVVASPVTYNGAVQYIIYFKCDINVLQDLASSVIIGDNGDSYILDSSGTMIAYIDLDNVRNKENSIAEAAANPNDKTTQQVAAIEQRMIAGETGYGEYHYNETGIDYIQGFAPIDGTDGWSIGVSVDKDEFMAAANTSMILQIVLLAVTFVLVLFSSIGIGRSIARPVVACSERLRKLSDGDLRSPVPQVRTKDETRVLADSTATLVQSFQHIVDELGHVLGQIASGDLTHMSNARYPGDFAALQDHLTMINDKLNRAMGEIVGAAASVSSGAEEMFSTSTILTHGAEEQANVVENLSVVIGEIANDSQRTVALAGEAMASASEAGKQMEQSSQYIAALNEAMSGIIDSSNEISKVIATIENIAFQTNILALNAAVEAARAGAAGKGFAVVADEVRNLAAKSDQAAKATKELIVGSITSIQNGSQVVNEVVQSMSAVTDLTTEAVKRMKLVAEAVNQQTDSISQINESAQQISAVVETNSVSARESANASQQLSDQADNLRTLVGGFRLRE